MAYIAIKNTEHKGVYKEEEFNKKILQTKGISHRKFKDKQYEDALKWAGVKDVKSGKVIKEKTKNSSSEKVATDKLGNSAFQTIEHIRKKGYNGVCITMKNNDEIIIKVNDMYVLKRGICFDNDKTVLENLELHINQGIEYLEKYKNYSYYSKPGILRYDLELINITNKSKYLSINDDYLFLNNFWTRSASNEQQSIYGNKKLMISRTIKIKNNHQDFWEPYNDLFLNINDIAVIKPLKFVLPERINYLGTITDGYCNLISLEEKNKIEQMYNNVLKKYESFKDILITEINE